MLFTLQTWMKKDNVQIRSHASSCIMSFRCLDEFFERTSEVTDRQAGLKIETLVVGRVAHVNQTAAEIYFHATNTRGNTAHECRR